MRTTPMKSRTISIALLSVLAACGSIMEESLVANAPTRPAGRRRAPVQETSISSEVDWFRSGPYVGVTLGMAVSNAEDSDIDSALLDEGIEAEADLDNNDVGWKIFGGYRFEGPFAMEIAAVDLGTIESDIAITTPNVSLETVAENHPFSAKGTAISGTWYAVDEEEWQLGLKGGLWWWDGEVEANGVGGIQGTDSDSGIDVLYGLVGTYDLGSGWALRGEVEHYRIDTDGVTFFAIGAQWAPPASSRRPAPFSYDRGLPPSLLRRTN